MKKCVKGRLDYWWLMSKKQKEKRWSWINRLDDEVRRKRCWREVRSSSGCKQKMQHWENNSGDNDKGGVGGSKDVVGVENIQSIVTEEEAFWVCSNNRKPLEKFRGDFSSSLQGGVEKSQEAGKPDKEKQGQSRWPTSDKESQQSANAELEAAEEREDRFRHWVYAVWFLKLFVKLML